MKSLKKALILAIISQTLLFCSKDEQDAVLEKQLKIEKNNELNRVASTDDGNLLLGNPSDAVDTEYNNYLLLNPYFTISYNNAKGGANWVSWHTDATDLGDVDRADNFRTDATLPEDFFVVKPSHYSNSGFDKGHVCPSGDRTYAYDANSETFLMSNMLPQAPNNNQKTWRNLETYLRSLILKQDKEVYVIAGQYGRGGVGKNGGKTNFLANGKINVPSNIWKVVVILDNGKGDLKRINSKTEILAVDTPNNQTINTDWKKYIVKVKDIEQKTGYVFFDKVSATVASSLKNKVYTAN